MPAGVDGEKVFAKLFDVADRDNLSCSPCSPHIRMERWANTQNNVQKTYLKSLRHLQCWNDQGAWLDS